MNEYIIFYLCNGKRTKANVFADSRASAAKWLCRYERNRGNKYTMIKANRVRG